jgi:putative Mg2+ transporter-C (MgtC) family protein
MSFAPTNGGELIGRLLVAIAIGGLIGWNRQITGKPAGLRTHMLVCLGAAVMVLIPLQISDPVSPDAVSRVIQGVATGIGFLGAGEILQRSRQGSDRPKIKGLTSAAAIWITAALGIATGCGFWVTSLVGTGFAWLILVLALKVEKRLLPPSHQDPPL